MPAPFDIDTGPISERAIEVARTELRETPEIREQGLTELRELLHQATDLHFRDDDEFLTVFLRPCKYYAPSAFKMLKRIAEFKKQHATLLKDIMPEDEKLAFTEHNIVNILTSRDQNGRRILIVNCGSEWDPKKVSSDQLFRLFYLVQIIAQLEEETQVMGVVVIMDFSGLSMKQIRGLTPQFSLRLLSFIQDAMPLRLKEVHIINQPFIFKMVWAIFKPFIRDKLKKRMFFHGSDTKKLHEYLDPAHLPSNYGGHLPAVDYGGKDWYPCVYNYVDHVEKWNTYGFANQIP